MSFIRVNPCFIRGLTKEKREMLLEHKDITEAIIGAAFEVHGILGYGFLEKVYQNAMQVEMIQRGHRCQTESPIKVNYKSVIVGEYRADLLIDEVVVVELKVARPCCGLVPPTSPRC